MENKRYKIIKTKIHNEWLANCPVMVYKSRLLEDTKYNELILQVKMFNNSNKHFSAVYIDVNAYDSKSDIVVKLNNIKYLSIDAKPYSYFGDRISVPLGSFEIIDVEIIISRVVFNNYEVWTNETKTVGEILEEQQKIDIQEDLYDQIIREFDRINLKPIFWFESKGEYWRCTCGHTNLNENNECAICGISKKWLIKTFDKQYLNNEYKKFKQIELLKREKQEKIKKIFIFSIIAIFIICFVFSSLFKMDRSVPLTKLVEKSNIVRLGKIVNLGRDIDETDDSGMTALNVAVEDNKVDVVKFLIDNGADVNIKNNQGETPLQVAYENNNTEIISMLEDEGAKAEISYITEVSIGNSLNSRQLYKDTRSQTRTVSVNVNTYISGDDKETKIIFNDYIYCGDFEDDQITGFGKLYDRNKNLIYSGRWNNGLYNGFGTIYLQGYDKEFLVGDFVNGNPISYIRYYFDGDINDSGTISSDGWCVSDKYGSSQY